MEESKSAERFPGSGVRIFDDINNGWDFGIGGGEYATDCKPQVSEKCNEIEYMECNEVPTEVCEKAEVQEPKQEFEHKKKCLLPDDGTLRKSMDV